MSRPADSAAAAELVQAVLSSSKYSDMAPDLVRHIASQELGKRRNLKEALKATKNKLHQVGGAYLDGHEDYAAWFDELRAVVSADRQEQVQQVCKQIMGHHASTRERIPILEQFYATIFSQLPPVRSVLDIACGLHPLALPWMNLEAGATYYAYDVYQRMTDFITCYLELMQRPGRAQARDVIQSCPTDTVDVAFVLKVLPCLEQVDKQASYHLLHQLQARYLIVSFPIHSLGGKHKGMAAYYEARFHELVAGATWEVQRLEFASELVFIVKK